MFSQLFLFDVLLAVVAAFMFSFTYVETVICAHILWDNIETLKALIRTKVAVCMLFAIDHLLICQEIRTPFVLAPKLQVLETLA